jgi:hypothetical protein
MKEGRMREVNKYENVVPDWLLTEDEREFTEQFWAVGE